MTLELYGSPVNNAGIDPLQGFDFDCWCQDTMTGNIAFFGRFQSLTLSIRDATETYLELGQRIPIYLNGEIQIAWVLEQGLVDMAFIVKTFGIKDIRRDQVISRGPRFHIAFDANAADKVNDTVTAKDSKGAGTGSNSSTEAPTGAALARLGGGSSPRNRTFGGGTIPGYTQPVSEGRYELMRCKVDSVSLGVMPGRRVAAVRWEGVSEGISYIPTTVQDFKNEAALPSTGGIPSATTGGEGRDTGT